MLKTVVGLFDSRDQAEKAVSALRGRGFYEEISVLAADKSKTGDTGENKGTGGSIASGVSTGGVLGGLAGLAMGAGALVIPGIGPILAAGPIAGLLSGAATGGIAGGLIDWGVPSERGRYYEGKVKEGKILASVRTDEKKIEDAAGIMRKNGAKDVETH
ncbi:general stress protein [Pelotomaculum terephthalicicum JT]|uniref:general stress protein n=1 Tax=Pelotomaculum TaxID=191373 RepID=UPI001F03FF4F|nr:MULTISPECIES: general stress protein [Pelotomaculum]MCG9968042.1 general stress protein [Pelotomaculum terephthalicicum JT]